MGRILAKNFLLTLLILLLISPIEIYASSAIQTFDELLGFLKTKTENMEQSITFELADSSLMGLIKPEHLNYLSLDSYEGKTSRYNGKITVNLNLNYTSLSKIINAHKTNTIHDLSEKDLLVYNKVIEVIAEIIKPNMTEYEKEKAVHDYLVLNAEYDHINLINNTVPDDSYTPYGILINGIGVCQGYAEAFKLFMDILEIECHLVTGTARGQNHMWNRVKIDGAYYMLDVTWNDPVPNNATHISYAYFNLTDEVMAKDHSWVQDEQTKSVSKIHNYYHYNNLVATNQEELEAIVQKQVEANLKTIAVLCEGFSISEKDVTFIRNYIGNIPIWYSIIPNQNILTITY